jgi:hypothetical protein
MYLPASQPQTVPAPPEESHAKAGRGKILVLDDEAAIRDLAREMFHAWAMT